MLILPTPLEQETMLLPADKAVSTFSKNKSEQSKQE